MDEDHSQHSQSESGKGSDSDSENESSLSPDKEEESGGRGDRGEEDSEDGSSDDPTSLAQLLPLCTEIKRAWMAGMIADLPEKYQKVQFKCRCCLGAVVLNPEALRTHVTGKRHLKNMARFAYYSEPLEPLLFGSMVHEGNLDRFKPPSESEVARKEAEAESTKERRIAKAAKRKEKRTAKDLEAAAVEEAKKEMGMGKPDYKRMKRDPSSRGGETAGRGPGRRGEGRGRGPAGRDSGRGRGRGMSEEGEPRGRDSGRGRRRGTTVERVRTGGRGGRGGKRRDSEVGGGGRGGSRNR